MILAPTGSTTVCGSDLLAARILTVNTGEKPLTSCEGKGWDKVTNPDAIIIDTFQVTRQEVSGFSPVLTVNMHAASKADPQTVVDASYSVTGSNL